VCFCLIENAGVFPEQLQNRCLFLHSTASQLDRLEFTKRNRHS